MAGPAPDPRLRLKPYCSRHMLEITVLAEGIESEQEFTVLEAAGIRLFQGYWFAKPAFEELPQVSAMLPRV